MEIEDWRRMIDEIDAQLVELLNRRSRCVIEIGRLKRAHNLPLYSPEREREVLERVRYLNRGPLDDEALQRLFEHIIDESRRLERLATESPDGLDEHLRKMTEREGR
ncbi:MAG: chorismate mutase [Blastocatellia bacterium]|nr:chorismate mutase [Blastocatellia bacterium]MCS7158228.1 chorismate mutase [Blastocatellia bacterium]MCX7753066.1 chorismate mutase [Blastocatellia bacterium]MDW8169382.1 chorismate mutase [Acidobacteriota bacterium]MDW8256449.1 chorismate mutase [Acidobacteriota bacterium]